MHVEIRNELFIIVFYRKMQIVDIMVNILKLKVVIVHKSRRSYSQFLWNNSDDKFIQYAYLNRRSKFCQREILN